MRRAAPSAEQLGASLPRPGPVRVVAGAGTGKTAVIANRYVRLLAQGVPPGQILVMTFSERAASELRERIAAAAPAAEIGQVGTFHALAQRWLRDDGARIGVSSAFRILAGPERWVMLRELMWRLQEEPLIGVERPDDLVMPLIELLERLRQELVPVARVRAWAESSADMPRAARLLAACRLFDAYHSECRRQRQLDFASLLAEAVRLLETQEEVRARYSGRFRWLMVDEYQDTNLAQERLVELIGGPEGNVFVVGDDDQSIYRFRGASRASMDRFLTAFPGTLELGLGRNLRSTGHIVGAAAQVIAADPARLPKTIAAARADGRRVVVEAFADGRAEASAIAAEVKRLIGIGVKASQIAILTRTHAIARLPVEALAAREVLYQQWSRQGFYERPEVRDVIAYLRLLRDPDDLMAVLRAATAAPVGLGLDEAVALVRGGRAEGKGPLAAVGRSPAAAKWARDLVGLSVRAHRLGVDEIFFELMSQTGYLQAREPGPETQRVVDNVSRFAELLDEFCATRADQSLGAFLDHLDLLLLSGMEEEVAPQEVDSEAVQVMTIHQAKGLEFDAVFVPSMVEGRLPHTSRRDGSDSHFEIPAQVLEAAVRGREDHLAEERRLCYVAMTRARQRLYLSWAERYDGSRVWRRSRFLDDLESLRSSAVRFGHLKPHAGETGEAVDGIAAPGASGGGLGIAALTQQVQLSFSAVTTYRECPRRYWFRYDQRLPASASVEGQYGTVVHETLRRAGELRQAGCLELEDLRRVYAEVWAGVDPLDPRRSPALQALGWTQLERYFNAGGFSRPPYLIEHAFTADFANWALRGVIDRVDGPGRPSQGGAVCGADGAAEQGVDGTPASAEGTPVWRLVDYKTGGPLPVGSLRRDLQLALYALGAREALGLAAAELEIVYLQTGRSVVLPADDDLMQRARAVGEEVAAGVRAGEFEPRPERRRCRLCPYRLACREGL